MKTRNLFIFSALLIGSILSNALTVTAKNDIYVFTHVNVIPMNTEIVLKDYNVIVEHGKIIAMGSSSSLAIPLGSAVINATGKFMIPALSDMHVHLEGDAWNIMFPPGSKYSSKELNFDDILFIYLANGITLINVMSALPEHIELRNKIAKNQILGPRLILSRMIDAAGKAWPPPICTGINNAEEAKNAVIDIHKQGYDRIKVYSFLSKESYDTIIATAKNLKMSVIGHIPYSTSVEHVLSSDQEMIAHVEEIMKFAKEYSPEQISYYASLVANNHTWLTSTLIVSHNFIRLFQDKEYEFSKPGTEYLHPMALGVWSYLYDHIYEPIPGPARMGIINGYNNFQKPFIREFYKKGGKLLIGTDVLMPPTLPGISLHEELNELVNAGLSPFEALKVSTTNSYEFLGETNTDGTIEPGKHANLILLDENPLENISNTRKIYGIMTQNQWITKNEIDHRLEAIKDRYSKLRNYKNQSF